VVGNACRHVPLDVALGRSIYLGLNAGLATALIECDCVRNTCFGWFSDVGADVTAFEVG